jgi:hypothetical protein
MNDREFALFVNNQFVDNHAATAKFVEPASNRGEIHWKLSANSSDPQKYYLVLRNASDGEVPTEVDADFSISFE